MIKYLLWYTSLIKSIQFLFLCSYVYLGNALETTFGELKIGKNQILIYAFLIAKLKSNVVESSVPEVTPSLCILNFGKAKLLRVSNNP